jgi:hypothetical protein
MRKLGQLGSMRAATLLALLAQNALVVHALALDEIGAYYIIATVAYLGNAAVFVGADLALQKKLAGLSVDLRLDLRALLAYVVATAVPGVLLLAVAASAYFWATGRIGVALPLICCLLSLSIYVASITRNLLLLCDRPLHSSLLQVIDAAGKLALVGALSLASLASARSVVLASAAASFFAAALGVAMLRRITTRTVQSYREPPLALAGRLASVGSSGLLNWAQLQGYRPLAAALFSSTEVVGAVALLTTLGGVAANGVNSVIGQMNVPRQYASKGATSFVYLQQLLLANAGTSLAMLPFAWAFLVVTGKAGLLGFLYLVVAGVLVEAGNAVIGVAVNHCNVAGQSLWHLPLAALAGCATTGGVLATLGSTSHPQALIAAALVLGQFTAAGLTWFITLRLVAVHAQ